MRDGFHGDESPVSVGGGAWQCRLKVSPVIGGFLAVDTRKSQVSPEEPHLHRDSGTGSGWAEPGPVQSSTCTWVSPHLDLTDLSLKFSSRMLMLDSTELIPGQLWENGRFAPSRGHFGNCRFR